MSTDAPGTINGLFQCSAGASKPLHTCTLEDLWTIRSFPHLTVLRCSTHRRLCALLSHGILEFEPIGAVGGVNTLCRCPQTASPSPGCVGKTSPPHISTLKISSSFCMKMTLRYLYFFFFKYASSSHPLAALPGPLGAIRIIVNVRGLSRKLPVAVFHPGDLSICCSCSTFDARCEAFLFSVTWTNNVRILFYPLVWLLFLCSQCSEASAEDGGS